VTGERLSRREFGGLLSLAIPAAVRSPSHSPGRSWRVTGRGLPGLGEFDLVIKTFMQTRDVTCGALAVTHRGRLVLARGYTWSADAALTTQPASLFRIASISKPITATVVLRLAQDGRLALTDRVAGVLGLAAPADPRLHDVTVLHLLRHLGGWDREVAGDPLFDDAVIARALGKRLPVDRADIVQYVTARPLDHTPGTAYAYSNYGYLLLGEVIERAGGSAYADQVRRTVLDPLAIHRMRLGRTLVPAPGEVPYYSQYTAPTVMNASGDRVPGPYGSFNHENNAFNCGWLASAVDLVRFATIYDGTTTVLTAESVARALAPPETGTVSRSASGLRQGASGADRGRYYGCGWHVGQGYTWHNGSLPGTYALLVRRFDGLAWAVLFDQRDDPSGERYAEIAPDLHAAADDVGTWPAGDLFGDHL
jgi:CubicO group peptidase (beta-lactamase class C family)